MRRRDFVKAIAGLAGVSPFIARAQLAELEKLSKAQAQYQNSPRGIAMCATCTLFVAPRACKVVDGDISPNGWCKEYAMAD
jgi:anaerobic selenocysteine-containing dehydrogenase